MKKLVANFVPGLRRLHAEDPALSPCILTKNDQKQKGLKSIKNNQNPIINKYIYIYIYSKKDIYIYIYIQIIILSQILKFDRCRGRFLNFGIK